MTLFDLASISANLPEAEARKIFFEKAGGDRVEFFKLMTRYWNSQKAVKVLDEIVENFWNIK